MAKYVMDPADAWILDAAHSDLGADDPVEWFVVHASGLPVMIFPHDFDLSRLALGQESVGHELLGWRGESHDPVCGREVTRAVRPSAINAIDVLR